MNGMVQQERLGTDRDKRRSMFCPGFTHKPQLLRKTISSYINRDYYHLSLPVREMGRIKCEAIYIVL